MNAQANQPYRPQPAQPQQQERVVVVEQSSGLGGVVAALVFVVLIGFMCLCCLIGSLMMV